MVEAQIGLDGVVLNGYPISEAIPPHRLHEVLGPPDRIVDPAPPAPFGHRNNQIHVYDSLGLYFNEHHSTRLTEDLVFVLWAEEEGYEFSPCRSFSGCLRLGGYRIPIEAGESEVIRDCPIPFQKVLSGSWRAKGERFEVGMDTMGAKMKSGRRSSRRRVVSIDVSW